VFLPYDGQTLPVADASVDRIVLYDAFHHIPNQERLLREMRRVLRPDGIVAMSEPGRGHSTSPPRPKLATISSCSISSWRAWRGLRNAGR
jgi:ubiquinone/menaquinone biosynthesis C-methylase UbiE